MNPRTDGIVDSFDISGVDRSDNQMERVTVFGDVTHVGSNFVDGSNLVVVGARTHFGAGIAVSLWRDAIEASVAVRDIADARGFDMLGFPLPGRSFAAELTWHTERAP